MLLAAAYCNTLHYNLFKIQLHPILASKELFMESVKHKPSLSEEWMVACQGELSRTAMKICETWKSKTAECRNAQQWWIVLTVR